MPPTFDPEAFGRRLREAMACPHVLPDGREVEELDVKNLQEQVRAATRGATGTSYGSIWSYVNGKAPLEPRREVVEALGEILDRVPHYLMFGEGPRTPLEAARREAETTPWDDDPNILALQALFAVKDRMPFDHLSLSTVGEQAWRDLAIELLASGGDELSGYSPEEMAEILEPLGWLWILPLAAFGTWEGQTIRDWDSYFLAMYQALRLAMPERGSGDPKDTARFLSGVREGMQQFLKQEETDA